MSNESRYKGLGILMIDMQESFLMHICTKKRRSMIDAQKRVIAYAGQNDIPFFAVVMKYCGLTISELRDCISSKIGDIEYLKKGRANAFYEKEFGAKDLAENLRKEKVERIFYMGVNASACVLSTALGGLEHGFTPIVSEDVVASPIDSVTWENSKMCGREWFKVNGVYFPRHKEVLS